MTIQRRVVLKAVAPPCHPQYSYTLYYLHHSYCNIKLFCNTHIPIKLNVQNLPKKALRTMALLNKQTQWFIICDLLKNIIQSKAFIHLLYFTYLHVCFFLVNAAPLYYAFTSTLNVFVYRTTISIWPSTMRHKLAND